jgi:hypothetical protein
MVKCCVFFEARTELLNAIQTSVGFTQLDQSRPWYSSALEQELCWYQHSTLHCMPVMQHFSINIKVSPYSSLSILI